MLHSIVPMTIVFLNHFQSVNRLMVHYNCAIVSIPHMGRSIPVDIHGNAGAGKIYPPDSKTPQLINPSPYTNFCRVIKNIRAWLLLYKRIKIIHPVYRDVGFRYAFPQF